MSGKLGCLTQIIMELTPSTHPHPQVVLKLTTHNPDLVGVPFTSMILGFDSNSFIINYSNHFSPYPLFHSNAYLHLELHSNLLDLFSPTYDSFVFLVNLHLYNRGGDVPNSMGVDRVILDGRQPHKKVRSIHVPIKPTRGERSSKPWAFRFNSQLNEGKPLRVP